MDYAISNKTQAAMLRVLDEYARSRPTDIALGVATAAHSRPHTGFATRFIRSVRLRASQVMSQPPPFEQTH